MQYTSSRKPIPRRKDQPQLPCTSPARPPGAAGPGVGGGASLAESCSAWSTVEGDRRWPVAPGAADAITAAPCAGLISLNSPACCAKLAHIPGQLLAGCNPSEHRARGRPPILSALRAEPPPNSTTLFRRHNPSKWIYSRPELPLAAPSTWLESSPCSLFAVRSRFFVSLAP